MAKKSKFFRVVTEGATTDGRVVAREWIEQMAATFDPDKYGARVWLEHVRGLLPDSPFKAYGDVLAVEAREDAEGKLGLYAQIEPTPELIELNKSRQKLYTSIEIDFDFAGSGQAYLTGLAVTDSPASLGTEMLQFTNKNPEGSPLTARKQKLSNLFSEGVEVELEFIDSEPEQPTFSERIKSFRQKFKKQAKRTDAQADELLAAVGDVAEFAQGIAAEHEALSETVTEQANSFSEDLAALKKEFHKFKQLVEQTDASPKHRAPATGGDGAIVTDC